MRKELRTPAGGALSQLIVTIFRINGRLLAAGDRLVEPFGLTSARWQVLGAIALSDGPEPVARLARNMGLHRQGVQRIVGDLIHLGLLEMRDNPHHRRAKLVVMTAEGRATYERALDAQAGWVNQLSERLDAGEIHDAARLLELIKCRLDHFPDHSGSAR